MATERGASPLAFEVLMVGGETAHSYRYRVEHMREQLGLAGVPVTTVAHGARLETLRPSRAGRAILLIHRMGLDAWCDGAILSMHRRGWPVVADIDDLVFDAGGRRSKGDAYLMRRCLAAADAILVTGAFLAEEAGKLGRPAHVHPNGPSLTEMALAERALKQAGAPPTDRVTIGYFSGTHTHDGDFRACTPALAAMLARHSQVRLLIVGPLDVDARLAPFSDRITHLPPTDWQRLPELIRQADINLAPLETAKPFCQAKSELKYIEAALLGVPTVASPIPAFRRAIADGINGLLVDGDDAWYEALRRLVTDAAWRRRLGEAARRDVYERYHPRRLGAELAGILGEIDAASRTTFGNPLAPVTAGRLRPAPRTV